MFKKMTYIVWSVLLLGLANDVWAVDVWTSWLPASGDWAMATNWANGSVPVVGGTYDNAVVNTGTCTVSTLQTANRVFVGLDNSGAVKPPTLNVNATGTGGSYGLKVTWNLDMGAISGATAGQGVLNVSGNMYAERFEVAQKPGSSCTVNILDGGVITVGFWGCYIGMNWDYWGQSIPVNGGTASVNLKGTGTMIVLGNETTTYGHPGINMGNDAHISIEAGTLYVLGDRRTQLQGYISSGKIIGYSGAGMVNAPTYDSASDYTSVTAMAPAVPTDIATQPNPANGATNVDLNSMLSWITGAGAISHTVYLGTASPGTLRNNQPVTLFYSGIPLAPETTYYWRIDEVYGSSTATGTVWSFTTGRSSGKCEPGNPCAGLGTTMHQAITPVARSGESWWVTRHNDILAQLATHNPVDLVFIGDSITQAFDAAVWNQYYASRNPLNLGFSGDMTQNVLWRLNHGELNGISPKLAVIMIGTNNTFPPPSQVYTAENIADGIKNICCTVRRHLPHTKILLLAIFPRGQYPSTDRNKNAAASVLASQIADGKTIFYLDVNRNFLDSSGRLSASIFPDYIHPNAAGDTIWANAMEPTIQKLMAP